MTIQKEPTYRHTKIICTIGPATQSDEALARLIRDRVDVVRLNMAHGSGEWAADLTQRVRKISAAIGRHVAVMMDVKGPEIRTGDVDQPIQLAVGDQLRFLTSKSPIDQLDDKESFNPNTTSSSAFGQPGSSTTANGNLTKWDETVGSKTTGTREFQVSINYPHLADDIHLGATILVDSGLLQLVVLEKSEASVCCGVLTAGTLGSRRHVNLPGVNVRLPALTEKDKQDLRYGTQAGIDFVALSFVRTANDVVELRAYLRALDSEARVIAKIEEQIGLQNMQEIIRTSDALMVARGDLGIEVDYHRLPLIQTQLVRACQAEGKPVIIATHLLESMIHSPMPTRAEVSDVSTAIREHADAVMLSGETTTGAYPFEAVRAFNEIIGSIEPTVEEPLNTKIVLKEPKAKMLRSAAVLAQELGKSGIVVFTRSGFLPYVLAALRPRNVPIFAFTDVEETFRQLLLPWGVEPFLMDFSENPEQTILDSIDYLQRRDWVEAGTWLVVITNALADDQIIDTLQLRQVKGST